LRLPVLLIGGSYLGAISHNLTALAALEGRGLAVRAIVVSETEGSTVSLADGAASVAGFAGSVPVLALPLLAPGAGHAVFGQLADLV
jgi:dethiobiotin synthetase